MPIPVDFASLTAVLQAARILGGVPELQMNGLQHLTWDRRMTWVRVFVAEKVLGY